MWTSFPIRSASFVLDQVFFVCLCSFVVVVFVMVELLLSLVFVGFGCCWWVVFWCCRWFCVVVVIVVVTVWYLFVGGVCVVDGGLIVGGVVVVAMPVVFVFVVFIGVEVGHVHPFTCL